MILTSLPELDVPESLAPWLEWTHDRLVHKDALPINRFLLSPNNKVHMLWQFAVTFDHTNKLVKVLEGLLPKLTPPGENLKLKEALLCYIDQSSNDVEFQTRTYLDEYCHRSYYVLEGYGTFTVNGETIAYSPGSVFWMPPNEAGEKLLASSIAFSKTLMAVTMWGSMKEPVYNLITMRRFGRIYLDPLDAPTVQQKE